MAKVITYLPEVVAQRVLSLAMEDIYAMTKKHPIFVEFFHDLVKNLESFRYTARILLDFFLTHLSEFEKKRDDQIPVIFRLFREFSSQINLTSRDDNNFLPSLHQLVIECMNHLYKSQHWSRYLDVLFGCFSILHYHPPKEQSMMTKQVSDELEEVENQVMEKLLQITQNCTDSSIRERIFEIAFRVSFRYRNKILFCVKALAGPDTLQQKGTVGQDV